MSVKPFRAGVVAVFQNSDGRVMGFRRTGTSAAWQFPQGGLDSGETPEQALYREVLEETGCNAFSIVKGPEGPINYSFPPDLTHRISEQYAGQSQFWYLCTFEADEGPDLAKASDQEFDQWGWFDIPTMLGGIISWKKDAYVRGLTLLGLLA